MSTITHVFNSHKRIESGRVVSHDFVPRMANLQYDFTGRRVLISIIPTLSPKYATLYKDTGNVLYYRGDDPDYRFELETWLGFGRGAFQHGIEDFHGIFGSFATVDVALFDVLQTQIDGREHLLEVVGANLESTGQRNLVVAVVGGDDTEVVADALVQIGVEAQLRLVGGTVQRVLGVARIDERTE